MGRYHRSLFLYLVFFQACNFQVQKTVRAQDAIADFREIQISNAQIYSLQGDWEFYPYQFVTKDEFHNHIPIFAKHPSSWDSLRDSDGQFYPRDGYGTYRVQILLSPKQVGRKLAFLIPEISSAYNLYVNGKLFVQQGSISANYIETVPFIKNRILKIKAEETLELVFHISNYGYNNGGFWSELYFGSEDAIVRFYYFRIMKEMFLLGSFVIMGLYHLGFYIFRPKEKSILYFSIFCFLISLRILVTGNRLLLELTPDIPWSIVLRLEYMSFYMAPVPFYLFVKSLFESIMLKFMNKIYILATVSFVPLVLFPIPFVTQTLLYFQILTLVGIIYVSSVLIRAVANRKPGATIFLIGWVFMASAVIYDIMVSILSISSEYIANYGLLIFIFLQSLILSSKFAKSLKNAEDISNRLKSYQQSLEKEVSERTKDISLLNQIAKEVNSSINLETIVNQISVYLKEIFGIEAIWILYIDRKEKLLKTKYWTGFEFLTSEQIQVFDNLTIPLAEDGGTLYRTFKRGKIFYLPRLNPELVTGYDRMIVELLQLRSLLQIPLIVHGNVIGILSATSYSRNLNLNKSQLAILSSISEQIAGAVNNSILLSQMLEVKMEVEKSYKEAESLTEITRKISSNSNLEEIFKDVESYLKENFGLNYNWLLMVDKSKNELYTAIFHDNNMTAPAIREKYKKIRIPLEDSSGSLYATYRRKKIFFLPRIPNRGIVGYDKDIIQDLQLKSFIHIPILRDEEVLGILTSTNLGGYLHLKPAEQKRIFRFATQIAGAMHNIELLEEAKKEREKADKLLIHILPTSLSKELKEKGEVEPKQYKSATILFTDFKDFTKITENLKPKELILQLDGMFLQFDSIMEKFHMEKLKTIGDSYMAAGGIPDTNLTHPFDACLAAIEILAFINQTKKMREMLGREVWNIRIGIHTGPVIAGIVGKSKFSYDVWGDTVNVASRMESSGSVGRINISESTYAIVKDFFVTDPRGKIRVKGKGDMEMYYLLSIRPEYSVKDQGITPNQEFYKMLEAYLSKPASSLRG